VKKEFSFEVLVRLDCILHANGVKEFVAAFAASAEGRGVFSVSKNDEFSVSGRRHERSLTSQRRRMQAKLL
jgi:hypothetical protein